jgi:hypothetical protein
MASLVDGVDTRVEAPPPIIGCAAEPLTAPLATRVKLAAKALLSRRDFSAEGGGAAAAAAAEKPHLRIDLPRAQLFPPLVARYPIEVTKLLYQGVAKIGIYETEVDERKLIIKASNPNLHDRINAFNLLKKEKEILEIFHTSGVPNIVELIRYSEDDDDIYSK